MSFHRIGQIACTALLTLAGCATVGEVEVHLESGNQPSGFLTRPLMLTTSSDESVRMVAQRICDNVRPGSDARISFVGKFPGPDPISLGDWGRYRYDCQMPVAAAPAPRRSAAGATAADAPAALPAVLSEADESHRRQCLRQLGNYQICTGTCLVASSSASPLVEAECRQRCATKLPSGCQ